MKNHKLWWLFSVLAIIIIISLALFVWVKKDGTKIPKAVEQNTGAVTTKLAGYESRTTTIQNLFAIQTKKSTTDISISIAAEDNDNIKGIISVKDGYEGIFLVKKINDQWQIVWDGQTKYSCADINQHQIPENISGCSKK